MDQQLQVAEASVALAVDAKAEVQAEPEPQLDMAVGSPTDDASSSKKKKKKKKKNRRKSLEKTQSEVEDMLEQLGPKDADTPEPEEEEEELQPKEDNQKDETCMEEKSVTKESTVTEESTETKVSTVTEESTVENSTVAEASSIENETVVVKDPHEDFNQEHQATSGDELAPPTVEITSSLDTLKASGTKAVGSLFSRFKVGRKKPLPSRTESAAKLELAVPSPVKTAVKKLEVPEQKNLEDLPVRTKRDFFVEAEQSIHVSTEKEKYDTLEKQKKVEKEAQEAAIVARRTPPSSMRSNTEVEAQPDAAKAQIEATTSSIKEVSPETVEDETVIDSSVTDLGIEAATQETASCTSECVVEEKIKSDDPTLAPTAVNEVEPTVKASSVEATVSTKPADEQTIPQEMEEIITPTPATETALNDTMETGHHSVVATTIEPVSLKLDLNLESRTEMTEATQNQVEERITESTQPQSDDTFAEPVETIPSTSVHSEVRPSVEVLSTQEAELLLVKVTPPALEIPAGAAAPAKPERLSPVKSLANRFEGKREQSLDTLKFRTVREFFPTERSIRVGAEKQKYEAHAQQQQLKAKAEEEVKSKYKTGFKSPCKESALDAPSTLQKAPESASMAGVATAMEPSAFHTPDAASSRKKFSFDESSASASSPSQFSDEALTPVKSIASRFEGKREQSLDSLKFRTVREFFPVERSVRVGSEKQKLEAQTQQENPLDKLKFRTVREFFPEEGKRSVHVGAEKAKFEALMKQQDEATQAVEQLKLKHAAPSLTAIIEKIDSLEVPTNIGATVETPSLTVAKSQYEESTTTTASKPEPGANPIEETDAVETDGKESLTATPDSDAAAPVEAEAEENDSTLSTDAEAAVVSSDDAPVVTDVHILVAEVKDAAPNVPASNGGTDGSEEAENGNRISSDETRTEQETEKAVVGVEDGLVEVDLEDAVPAKLEEPADAATTEMPVTIEQIEENQRIDEVEAPISNGLVDLDLEDSVVNDLADSNVTATSHDLVSEQSEKIQESIEIAEEKPTISDLVELESGTPVEEIVTVTTECLTTSTETIDLDIQQPVEIQDVMEESRSEVEESAPSTNNGLVELDLGEPAVVAPNELSSQESKSKRPMLTTERSFVMEDDHTIETEDTVVVGERPMTDGEDEFEPLSQSKTRPAHELFAGVISKSKKEPKKTSTPKLARKVSAGSVGSAKSLPTKARTIKRASSTAPTASILAKNAAEAEKLHKSSPQLKKKVSSSTLKDRVSKTGSIKPPPAAPIVPIPMKRASITAPTASYMARKAAGEEAHSASSQAKQHHSVSKQKGSVSETGLIKPPPAAPTVPVPMKRVSITAPTASWQARGAGDHTADADEFHTASKHHMSKTKATVGSTGFVKPNPPTISATPKRASIMAPTASFKAKKTSEHAEEVDIAASSVPMRKKQYANIKSKVLEGIQSGSTRTVTHKKITKEEFIAAERRKSLGSAGVRSALDVVDRRASLTARMTIDGPPEPFIRSAHARKKLNSTIPRYMNYENAPGYAERARQQYERRKRLEEENAAKSEKRQRELRVFFADQQHKSVMSSADEVRRGLEAHEFAALARDGAQKALRREKHRTRPTRTHQRASSATSSADASSSNGVTSRTSKKSSVSSVSVEEKVLVVPVIKSTDMERREAADLSTVVTEETVDLAKEEVVIETMATEEKTIAVPAVDDDPKLKHVAKEIDFDELATDGILQGELLSSTMGNWLGAVADSTLDYLDDLSDKKPMRSWLKRRSKSKKELFQEKLQPRVAAAIRHKSVVRASILVPGPNDIPHVFTAARPLNVEWNLCDKVDPTRRVDVVSDHKLLRKRQKGLFVDKNTRLQVHCDTRTLAQNELEIMCYIANYCETHKHPIHRNVVHLLGYYSANEKLHEIIEFCELGTLMNAYIESPQESLRLMFSPTEGEVCDAMFQICSGLQFLHEHGIAHGNLGLENVFVTSENILKIGDFEHSVFVGSDNIHQPLPKLPPPPLKAYIAPEVEASKPGERLDLQKADVWSVGIMFILLLTKKPLFDAARPDDNGFQMFCRVGLRSYLKVMYLEQSAICKLSEEVLQFAEGLLNMNPSSRFTMREALDTNWLKNEKASGRPQSGADDASYRSDAINAHLTNDGSRKF